MKLAIATHSNTWLPPECSNQRGNNYNYKAKLQDIYLILPALLQIGTDIPNNQTLGNLKHS